MSEPLQISRMGGWTFKKQHITSKKYRFHMTFTVIAIASWSVINPMGFGKQLKDIAFRLHSRYSLLK